MTRSTIQTDMSKEQLARALVVARREIERLRARVEELEQEKSELAADLLVADGQQYD